MIDRLILKNFKVLRDVDVPLRPLTLVVGPNASGKSSVLQALGLIFRITRPESMPDDVLPPDRLRSVVSEGELSLACAFDRERVTVEVRSDAGRWTVEVRSYSHEKSRRRKLAPPPNASVLVRKAVEMNLQVGKMAAPSYSKEILSSLPPDGEGLSAFLANLHVERPAVFKLLVEKLRSIVPVVRNIRLKPTYIEEGKRSYEKKRMVGYQLIFDMQGAEGVPAYAISEGTLLTLGLLTSLFSPVPPRLLLIDELERGLHPKALGDLVKQIRAIQVQDPGLQIVATSHSPYLLDYLDAKEILLTSLGEDGYASIRPLSDHPDYERWKDVMAPGEFWSTVGEEWVTEKTGA